MTRDPDPLSRYRAETDASPADGRRLVGAVRAAGPGRAPVPPSPLRLLVPGVLALAAAVALVVAWPKPPPPPAEPVALWSPDAPQVTEAGDGVELSWQGTGALEGTRLAWEAGAVAVEVPPDRGLTFTVATREATVRVVGTGFTVRRDALGTTVEVRHGRVSVTCEGDAGETFLDPGDTRSCAPTSAPGLLARAQALRGAHPADALRAASAGLDAGPSPAVEVELRYLRAELAAAAGDPSAARADLTAILGGGESARSADATSLLATLPPDPGSDRAPE